MFLHVRSARPPAPVSRPAALRRASPRRVASRLARLAAWAVLAGPGGVAVAADLTIPDRAWVQVSVPARIGMTGTVERVFGGALDVADYGTAGTWVMYARERRGGYRLLAPDDALRAGEGYWMLQANGAPVTVALPDAAASWGVATSAACPSSAGCVEVSLEPAATGSGWRIAGLPLASAVRFGDTRFVSEAGACAAGCTPGEAAAAGVGPDTLQRWDAERGALVPLGSADSLRPWGAAWMAVPARGAALWLVPVAEAAAGTPAPSAEPVDVAQRTPARAAEVDAARLLTQATFGPDGAAIRRLAASADPAGWVDAQLALPPTRHLPAVRELDPDDGDDQQARYRVFWDRALGAPDQLRQRVAFALSEIMVVSDVSDALTNHGDLLASYFDTLLEHAFGDYRDLLEAVTLHPATGLFLSSLGNDRPDPATGRRADENFAREVMQLFSIGLVELDAAGRPVTGADGRPRPAFEQADVAQIARVFTGLSWDRPDWSTDVNTGWMPDRGRLTRPMKGFPAHHDPDAKRFLGIEVAAGGTPASDLAAALDRLATHPNTGPFIARRLIQRLVTSNPSPGYVARVAAAFADDGTGRRGQLGATVRAILLDAEARDPGIAARADFGKLREPLLRVSHLLRAGGFRGPFPLPESVGFFAHLAPLTAPSVFNFFFPDHAPAGPVREAGLVAPEFQINGETRLTTVHDTIMWLVQRDAFFGRFPVRLDLSPFEALAGDAAALVDELDLVFAAGGLSAPLRELLTRYAEVNREAVGRERLVRDLVSLVVTSADQAVQR